MTLYLYLMSLKLKKCSVVSMQTSPRDLIKLVGKLSKHVMMNYLIFLCYIFNMSFRLHTIPRIWKLSEIVHVPKKPRFQIMNDLRPVALTSIIMKCFERLVLSNLKNSIRDSLDPFQFAYREKRNVEDAIIIFVSNVLKHLEGQRKYARCLFIDFSSAFNTIQPHMLTQKLLTYPKINKNMKTCSKQMFSLNQIQHFDMKYPVQRSVLMSE